LKNLMESNRNVKMIEIEENEMDVKLGELKKKHNRNIEVMGFPTIIKICGNKIEYFQGERTVDELRKWILTK